MSDEKHYYAFISHSSEDEKTALWLRDQLENYHIPSVIQRDFHAPKRLKPVFVYQTDLAGLELKKALGNALSDSHFLIVLCSPSAAKSDYVNGEVQHFIDTGRADKIVPFIIAGTPYASQKGKPEEECFPPALFTLKGQDKEQRGINLPEMQEKIGSKKAAVVNIIASMLGVRFDVLWDRYKRRRIRQYCIAATMALLLCMTALFIWDYNRPTYRYFADYVDCWGVPEGVIELTKEQQRHRSRMYQFEYRRISFGEPNAYDWRVVKVSYVNSAHMPQEITHTEYQNRYPIQRIQYSSQTGTVMRYVFSDIKDRVLLHHIVSEYDQQPATVVDFINSEEQRGQGFVGGNLSSISIGEMGTGSRSSISRYVYDRDSNGYIIKQTYHANNDYNLSRSAIPDANGIFGRKYKVDSLGRMINMKYIGMQGEVVCTKIGVAEKRYTYDNYGNICRSEYLDVSGQPVINEVLWATGISVSNEWGNIIEERSLGPNNMPCNTIYGYSICRAKYDTYGNEIECDYLDTLGESCIISIMGCSKWRAKYSKIGDEIERSCWNSDTTLCLTTLGAAIFRSKYDNKRNLIECAYYDTEDKPCLGIWGFHSWRAKYDTQGNEIERLFYDIDGHPSTIADGYFRRESKYDTDGHKIEERYYDIHDSLCRHVYGYAIVKVKYDMRGNCIEERYFDKDGKLCNISDGFAIWEAKYDEQGHRVQEAFFDTLSQPCLCTNHYARVTSVYNERGYCVELIYYDTQGNMTNNDKGYARVKIDYDEYGNIIKQIYYTKDDSRSLIKTDVKKWRPKFNGKYEIITIQYEDGV